ncbi:hypothetical protein SCHPADRAFT_941804 [Schizopora paradoxa]|uniref:Prenylcysteine lyase domain-containing protein n=1 Tax=Schizopora paradoxa TaxID=27342 RepID=A0A0H2RQI1_9AGAM|nr:hypothetical protein SCHPADRAFT_941804 [Schizopora paradoxa]
MTAMFPPSRSLFLVYCAALAFFLPTICGQGLQAQQEPYHTNDANANTTANDKPTNGDISEGNGTPYPPYPPYPGLFNVAIIGAGAAGSSAAYWLSLAKKRLGLNVAITIYENSTRIGGRSTVVHPYDDETLPPIELGASIFVEANKNMMRAAKEFNLTLRHFGDKTNRMGIWDGDDFVLELGPSEGISSWLNSARVTWRYGLWSTLKTKGIVANMLKNFVTIYDRYKTAQWDSVNEFSQKIDIVGSTMQTAEEYFKGQGVKGKFVEEMIDAATRANYGQDISDIHGFGSLVSLAAEGASRIREGNFKIFESFLNQSGANVIRNASVDKITQSNPWSNTIFYTTAEGRKLSAMAAHVIIAAPLHNVPVSFTYPGGNPGRTIPEDRSRYVKLHTTLLTTTAPYPSSEYFYGAGSAKVPPRTVLTTGTRRRHGQGAEPEFNSLSYLDVRGVGQKGEFVVKIFSKKRLSDEWLAKMFGAGAVGWVHRKEWDAYPYLTPSAYFTPIRLADSIYYVNGMETLVSTMETEIVAARNVVDMLLRDKVGQSLCPPMEGDNPPWRENSVYGWDCY